MKINISENIKSLRKQKGITQEVLAEYIGVSVQAVSKWECGLSYPDMELLPKLSSFLNVTIDFLLTSTSEKNEKTFESFIVSNSNKFAYEICIAICGTPAVLYNPIFIYGASGSGKTHLLHAIRYRIREKFPDFKIVQIKGDKFNKEITSSIQNGTMHEFREKYRNADILLCDDVHIIGAQEEFFHTFDTLYKAKKQIILTSAYHPKDIHNLYEKLATRYEYGIIAAISSEII